MVSDIRKAALIARFWAKVRKTKTCWVWTAGRYQKNIGYGCIWIDGASRRAHRVAWRLAYGPIPPGKIIRHRCDNKICVRPSHLQIGTHADNMRDMRDRGRYGDRAKLSTRQVAAIRAQHQRGGITLEALAAKYAVTGANVGYIVRGATWRFPEAGWDV